ncbi:MAG TPA: hypothetical protein VGC95_10730, partial [Chitinophagaceae bacterium]
MISRTLFLYRSAGMGDVLWTEPLVREMAKRYRRVVLFTKFKELFNNYPLPNVVVRDLPSSSQRSWLRFRDRFRRNKLYHKLDGVYEANPKKHMLHAYQEYFRLPVRDEYPQLYLNDSDLGSLQHRGSQYVVLHLDANTSDNYRKVFGVDWNEIVRYLRSKGLEVVLTGDRVEPIDGADTFKGSLRELIMLIS